MKRITRVFFLFSLLLSGAPLAFAAMDPVGGFTTPQTFTFYCDTYTDPFTSGGYYSPTEGGICHFAIPAMSKVGKTLAVYRGTVGKATLVESGLLINDPNYAFLLYPNQFGASAPGDNFFGVAYSVGSQADVDAAADYFTTGNSPAPTDLNVLAWKWGLPLTVTADDKTAQAGSLPAFTATFSGFPAGHDASDITGSASCGSTATPTSPAGDYPIICTQGTLSSPTYAFVTFVAGTLHLTAPPDLTAPVVTVVSRVTNDLSPVITGTIDDMTASVNVVVGGVTYPASLNTNLWSIVVPEGTLADGVYPVAVTATDPALNQGQANGTLTLDRVAPSLAITSGPAQGSFTNANSATFTFTSDAPTACSLDSADPVPCSGSFSASGLVPGSHLFEVTATDTAGNISKLSRTWSIDTIAPILVQVLPVPTPATDTTPDYTFNSTKAGTIIYGGSCSSVTVAATTGDNAVTFNTLVPGTYSNCTIKVTDSVGNQSAPLAVRSFTIITPPPQITTVTVPVLADTYVRKGASNTNEGASPILRIRAAGDNRALVRFDQAAIATAKGSKTLVSATLEFTITETKNNWGKNGREISAHRLLADWAEGNGKNGELPGNESFRGTGTGATWNCSKDTNINNQKEDCTAQNDWEMRINKHTTADLPWTLQSTDSMYIQKGQQGVVDFDVTADVQTFLNGASNYGWVIRKNEEDKPGYITFASKESSDAGPTLTLVFRQ